MQNKIRAHPITVLSNLWRVRFLVIIPVLRGLAGAISWDFAAWLAGAWLDVLILLIMVGFAALRAWRVRLWWRGGLLFVRTGLLMPCETVVPWEKIVTVSVTRPLYLRMFGAVRLRLDTLGGSASEADFTFLLRPQAAGQLLSRHGWTPPEEDSFVPSTRSVLVQSMIISNSLGGVLFAAALISQSGRLFGRHFTGEIVGVFEQFTRALAFGLPPAGVAVAYALLGGWLISFTVGFARHKDMRVSQRDGMLQAAGGALTKRCYSVKRGEISCLEARQNLLARLLGRSSLLIAAPGYAKGKAELACLIPAQRAPGLEAVRERFFPGLDPAANSVTPVSGVLSKFIFLPCLLIAGTVLAAIFLCLWFGYWWRLVLFVGGMAMVPALILLAVRIIDFRTGGIGHADGVYTLRYSRWFYLREVTVPVGKIVQVQVQQSFFQKRSGRCNVIVHTRSEGKAIHRLKGLPVDQAKEALWSIDN